MSEISQITAGTETYTLKDTTARTAASGAVKNVNGKSPDGAGQVTLTASDVSALGDDYTPPVTSVNDKTGAVNIKLDPYPVGAIYISVNSTSPASLFGGTWEVINDRFLLAGSAAHYKYGSTGGAATVTLTKDQMPQHQHQFSRVPITDLELSAGNNFYAERSTTTGKLVNQNTETQGSNKAHNNMPPYLSVYMWKRTA